ncbi:MAG TPA: DUF262 domain-containing protein [Gemmatimonadales bacterium]|nr:DUF262 domain-containing protein [Gemmatimonadales bacterium]
MSRSTPTSREVDGKGRTVREVLAGRKYSIDYYQREYKWQTKQVEELVEDLAAKFLDSHEEGNERSAVADYGHLRRIQGLTVGQFVTGTTRQERSSSRGPCPPVGRTWRYDSSAVVHGSRGTVSPHWTDHVPGVGSAAGIQEDNADDGA